MEVIRVATCFSRIDLKKVYPVFYLQGLSPEGTVPSLIDSQNIANLTSKEDWSKTTYFDAYRKSFAEGEYNIQEPVYTPTGQAIRSYMSGGEMLAGASSAMVVIPGPTRSPALANGSLMPVNYPSFGSSPLKELSPPAAGSAVRSIDGFGNSSSGSFYSIPVSPPVDYLNEHPLFKEDRINSIYFRKIVESVAEEIGGKAYVCGSLFYLVDDDGYVPLDMINDIDIETSFFLQQNQEDEFIERLNKKLSEETDKLGVKIDKREQSNHSYMLICYEPYRFPYNKRVVKNITFHRLVTPDVDTFLQSLFDMPVAQRGQRYLLYERFIGDFERFEIMYQKICSSRRYPGLQTSIALEEEIENRLGELAAGFVQKDELKGRILERLNSINMPWKFSKKTSSPLGGIDFRSLPIVTQAMTNLSANISSSTISRLSSINLDEEWVSIERMVSSGIKPSTERIKEYTQASSVLGKMSQDKEKIILCIADILRQEEEQNCETDPILRDILVVLESVRQPQELRKIFLGELS